MTAAESSARPRPLGFIWRALRPDVPFYLLVASFIIAAIVSSRAFDYPRQIALQASWHSMWLRTATYALPALVAALCWAVTRRGRTLRDPDTWIDTVKVFFEPSRTARFLVLFLVLPSFMNTFVAFKASIPDVAPFAWDARFMSLDRLLHLGYHPWALLQGLLGSPAVTVTVDLVYISWFSVLILTVIWQAWHGDYFSEARSQFLLAFAACWLVVGVVFATLLASAGPVYYEAVVGDPEPFAALVHYLHAVNEVSPLKAVWIQGLLWESYVDPSSSGVGEGISAMPSMHVSMAVLMMLVGFRVHRLVGWAYAAFALAILIGSVHLAWHYAIDGYLAALLTLGIWWASGRLTAAWNRRTSATERPA